MSELQGVLEAIRALLEEQVGLLKKEAEAWDQLPRVEDLTGSQSRIGSFEKIFGRMGEPGNMITRMQAEAEARQAEARDRENRKLAIEEKRNELLRTIAGELSVIRQCMENKRDE